MSVKNLIFAAAGQVGGGYQISRSLRFNSADSAYLSRTPASAGDRKTWTWSGWVKRSELSTARRQILFASAGSDNNTVFGFGFEANTDQFFITLFNTSAATSTARLLRDPSAWYHIVLVLDTTQATQANRAKVYVNNEGPYTISLFSQNTDYGINNNSDHRIGEDTTGYTGRQFGGYLADINFVDGSALTPSSFGETNETTGVWSPIAYAGSYGTNGFYLNFSDNTSTTTLGEDQAGSNDWTLNNLATSDSMLDTPSNNFAVMNPLSTTQPFTFLEGNLRVYGSTSIDDAMVQATIGMRTGKWYWETLYTDSSNTGARAGISADNTYDAALYYVGETTKSYGINFVDGNKFNNASNSSYGSAFTQNSILMTAYDADNGKLWWGIDGIWYASGDPATGTNAAFTSIPENDYFPTISDSSLSNDADSFWLNFGQDSTFAGNKPIGIATDSSGVANFQYTPPSGFKALVTTNLPEPTVVQGDDYFNTVLYDGTGAEQAVAGVGFQPDFVWTKLRSQAGSHFLADVIRGGTAVLKSDLTDAEVTRSNHIQSFDTDGFTLGADGTSNLDGTTNVAWNWKANGAGVSNTDGTNITTTVSVDQTAGISVLTYTGDGNGSSSSIGHGLGVVPAMVIIKSRSDARSWVVKHKNLSSGNILFLESTAAQFTAAGNNSGGIADLSSSTVVSFVTGAITTNNVNANTENYVAYCFAEVEGFSKFSSYTGNGSADGSFIFTGFKVAWVIIKRTDNLSEWAMYDLRRPGFNPNYQLRANASDAENSNSAVFIDLVSNGFKIRTSDAAQNASGGTYIYAAFAENPFKYSLAR
jgi:hypothetical protein